MGVNPFMKSEAPPPPIRGYVLRVKGTEVAIHVDPANLPHADHGQEGSLLTILMANGIDVEHVCGGVCACSTCHVYVIRGDTATNEASDDELDMLDTAPALRPTSRLACQCVPTGESDIEVEVPAWNRNAVKEGH
ncbi:MAG: 2Fe-2S iron-sulfur cluster binding domain-containing protein [Myxococcales bacterium]|nr:2Fe-2S iron-sulfur cluster binding domain-containing protein [Myxococcales bacterium]